MTVTVQGLKNPGGLRWTFSGDGVRTYRFVYNLDVTDPPDQVATSVAVYAALAAFTPSVRLGQPCPLDTGALCNLIDPEAIIPRRLQQGSSPSSYWRWEIAVGYSSKLGEEEPSDEKNPTSRPPSISFDIEPFESEATTNLKTSGAVVNSAGDPQVRPKRRSRVIVRIEKNIATWDYAKQLEAPDGYLYSRNLAAWTPAGPYTGVLGSAAVQAGKALCTKLTSTSVVDNGTRFAKVNGEFALDPNSHEDWFVDQGFFYLKNGKTFQFLAEGGWSTQPKLLDGTGKPLSTGSAPFIHKFQYYPTKDWSALGLP